MANYPGPTKEFETVAECLERVEVPGGWLYRTRQYGGGWPTFSAPVFVPTPLVEEIEEEKA